MIGAFADPPKLAAEEVAQGKVIKYWRNERSRAVEQAIFAKAQARLKVLSPFVRKGILDKFGTPDQLNSTLITLEALRDYETRTTPSDAQTLRGYADAYESVSFQDKDIHNVRLQEEDLARIEAVGESLIAVFGQEYPLYHKGKVNKKFVLYLLLETAAQLP